VIGLQKARVYGDFWRGKKTSKKLRNRIDGIGVVDVAFARRR